MIKYILLDVDGTLLDFHKCADASMEKAFLERGLPFDGRVPEAFHKINDSLWLRVEKGELTREELYSCRWNLIFERLKMDEVGGRPFDDLFRSYLTRAHEPVDGALELLERLSGRYRLYVASNAQYDQQYSRLNGAGMLGYIEEVFVSEKAGASKPDRAFFDYCLERLGSPSPDEVMLIGDSLTADIAGGIACGIHTCFFNPKHIPLPEGMVPDQVVASLSEIDL